MCAMFSFPVFARESIDLGEIVVTPLGVPSDKKYQAADTVSVETQAVEDKDFASAGEVLDLEPGVDVVGGGRVGSASQGIYLRGAQPRHTSYIFEGIKLYDPSNTSGYYVPSDFLLSGLERVEAVKMPLSSLYGSSAIGGVVNFLAKKPQGEPYAIIKEMAGSHDTYEENVEAGGKVKNISYLLDVSRLDSRGISQAQAKNNNPERDAYQNTSVVAGINYQLPQDLELGLTVKGTHARRELDADNNYDGIPEDDPLYVSWNDEMLVSCLLSKTFTPYLTYKMRLGGTDIRRRYHDDVSHANDKYSRSWYKGMTYQLNNSFEITPCKQFKMLVGFDWTRERVESYSYTYNYTYLSASGPNTNKDYSREKGWFAELIANPTDELELDYSYRLENNPLFKDHSVNKVGASYALPTKTTLYSSYGEGFKSPSLYQLYSSNGNPLLKPEESRSWEAGVKQELPADLKLSLAYTHSDFTNLIDFVYTNPAFYQGRYLNATKGKSRGIELKLSGQLGKSVAWETGYAYLNGEQDFVGADYVTIASHPSVRIPANKAFGKITKQWDKFSAGIDLLYEGKRYDHIWVGMNDQFVTMKPYWLGNLDLKYKIKQNAEAFLNVANLLNKNYERIKGYGEEKISFYGGVNYKF